MRDKLIYGIHNKVSRHIKESICILLYETTPFMSRISSLKENIVLDLYRETNEKP